MLLVAAHAADRQQLTQLKRPLNSSPFIHFQLHLIGST